MAFDIASQNVIQWALNSFGKEVFLTIDYDYYGNGSWIVPAGERFFLDGIQKGVSEVEAILFREDEPGLIFNPPLTHLQLAS